jgi:hypothetical protein
VVLGKGFAMKNVKELKPDALKLLVDTLILKSVIQSRGVSLDRTNNYIHCMRVVQIEYGFRNGYSRCLASRGMSSRLWN